MTPREERAKLYAKGEQLVATIRVFIGFRRAYKFTVFVYFESVH